ncbi:MAG: MBL fold metallo-hydrolase [Chloroflexota bacterium]|nr:MBL fold metallo-hydrolase [Chloroflexota bacterium]
MSPARRPHLSRREGTWLIGLGLLLAGWALLLAALAVRPDGLLHFWALDVGQGDALLIQTPSGQDILVDGGPDPAAVARELGRHLPFWQRDLELVVLTHPHEDHIAGLIDTLDHYRVGSVLQTPFAAGDAALEAAWGRVLTATGVPVHLAVAGQAFTLEPGVAVQVLAPPPALLHGTHSDINNSSVVLRLTYGTVGLLLAGDIETEAGGDLLTRAGGALRSQVLKVPHHGSASGLSAALLAAIQPQVALISVGADNRYGHPAPATLDLLRAAGVPTYRTDTDGTVEILSDGQHIWVRPEKH